MADLATGNMQFAHLKSKKACCLQQATHETHGLRARIGLERIFQRLLQYCCS